MKKGRHRRYEEARKFQRDTASQFTVEDFDFDATDPFSLRDDDDAVEDAEDDQYGDVADKYDDHYADLAAKYADFDTSDEDKG